MPGAWNGLVDRAGWRNLKRMEDGKILRSEIEVVKKEEAKIQTALNEIEIARLGKENKRLLSGLDADDDTHEIPDETQEQKPEELQAKLKRLATERILY